jgi:hypothetical protein
MAQALLDQKPVSKKDQTMSEVTTRPATRATKAPPSTQSAPATPPEAQAEPESIPITADEAPANGIRAGQRSVAAKDELVIAANTVALLTQAAGLINDEAGAVHASTLLEFGKKVLQQVVDGNLQMGTVQEAFFYAAGACAGALAIEQRDHPSARHRYQLIDTAYQVLNNAGLSYDCELNANDVAAAAIDAGARQFRDRPTPPIRRVDEPSQPQAGYRHSPRDIRAVFETMATQCEAVRDFSVDIRSRLQGDSSSVVEACNDLIIVQHMVAFMGSMCEEMRGGVGVMIGGPAAWATMDGIEAIGGAA